MVPITKLRRSSFALAFLLSGIAYGQSQVNMPKLSNVGIIPVQWQGGDLGHMGLNAFRVHIDKAFPEIVRASHRFRVLNDKLVDATWATGEGRAELVADYELHGFMNLIGNVDGDVVRLQMRLLGPDMQIYLLEEEALGISRIKASTEKLSKRSFEIWLLDSLIACLSMSVCWRCRAGISLCLVVKIKACVSVTKSQFCDHLSLKCTLLTVLGQIFQREKWALRGLSILMRLLQLQS